jgi:CelD/BcsL family acetyltransferase involved in cellulose biosynthesis
MISTVGGRKDTTGGDLRSKASCTVLVVTDSAEWLTLESAWKALWNVSPTASATLRWEWLSTWWRVYGPKYGAGQNALRILIVQRGTDIIGALPLYVGYPAPIPFAPRPLRFLSTGESGDEETCAAYLDLLHKPGEEKACVTAIERTLANGPRADWERLELSYLPGTSPLASLLSDTPHDRRWTPERQAPCCIANLSGGIEEYLGRLSSNSRAQARRLLRAVDAARLNFEVATPANVDEFYDQLVELHQARWAQAGQPGCFASPRFSEFHRSLAHQLIPTKDAVLARLTHEGRPLAVIQGYKAGRKFDYYLAGTAMDSENGPIKSPGIAAHLLLKSYLYENGVTYYDYLLGYARNKAQYTTDEHPISRLVVERKGLKRLAHQLSHFSVRGARAIKRMARGQS